MVKPYDVLTVYKVKSCEGDVKERILHRNILFSLQSAYVNENMDSQDLNIDSMEAIKRYPIWKFFRNWA